MSTLKVAALQNAKVWARRMEIDFDQDQFSVMLESRFPGSVLKGPLILVASRYLKVNGLIADKHARHQAAFIIGNSIASIVRGDKSGDILKVVAETVNEIGTTLVGVTFAMHSVAIRDAVNKAIAARTAEKNAPSLAQMIINQARGH